MKPRDLISSARTLVTIAQGKPSQVALRRAVSAAYYALFHHLARTGADLLMGGVGAARSKHAWRQTYRALSHGTARKACTQQSIVRKFPKEIEDFANNFRLMQSKRYLADYDLFGKFTKSEVLADIDIVEQAIAAFDKAEMKDRRAFCAYVLFDSRKDH